MSRVTSLDYLGLRKVANFLAPQIRMDMVV